MRLALSLCGLAIVGWSGAAEAAPRTFYGLTLNGYAWGNEVDSSLQFSDDYGFAGGSLGVRNRTLRAEAGNIGVTGDGLAFSGRSFQGLNLGFDVGRVESTVFAGRTTLFDSFTNRQISSGIYGVRGVLPLGEKFEFSGTQVYTPRANRDDTNLTSLGINWRPNLNQLARVEVARSDKGQGVQLLGGWQTKRTSLRGALRTVSSGFSTAGNPILRSQRSGLELDARQYLSGDFTLGLSAQQFVDGFGGHSRYQSADLQWAPKRGPLVGVFTRLQDDSTSFSPGNTPLQEPVKASSTGFVVSQTIAKTDFSFQADRLKFNSNGFFNRGTNDRFSLGISRQIAPQTRLTLRHTVLSPIGDSLATGNSSFSAVDINQRLGKRGVTLLLGVQYERNRQSEFGGSATALNTGFFLPMGSGNAIGVQYRTNISKSGLSSLEDTLYLSFSRNLRIGRAPAVSSSGFINATPRERRRFGGVRGRIFDDLNNNGVWDKNEPGVPDVTLLTGYALSGRTSADGTFQIPEIYPGAYNLSINLDTLPIEYAILVPDVVAYNVPVGKDATVNFPVLRTGTISGIVFRDDNRNGIKDQGEEPLSEAIVRVMNSNIITFSQPDGTFTLSGLAPKTWNISVDAGAFTQGIIEWENTGSEFKTINVTPNGTIEGVVMGVAPKDRAPVFESFTSPEKTTSATPAFTARVENPSSPITPTTVASVTFPTLAHEVATYSATPVTPNDLQEEILLIAPLDLIYNEATTRIFTPISSQPDGELKAHFNKIPIVQLPNAQDSAQIREPNTESSKFDIASWRGFFLFLFGFEN